MDYNVVCDHRDASGGALSTWQRGSTKVCPRCVEKVRELPRPVAARQMMQQMNYAAIEMRAMTGMMRDVGMEFVNDEVMSTEEQFEEFKKRWIKKYPDRRFTALYGSSGTQTGRITCSGPNNSNIPQSNDDNGEG